MILHLISFLRRHIEMLGRQPNHIPQHLVPIFADLGGRGATHQFQGFVAIRSEHRDEFVQFGQTCEKEFLVVESTVEFHCVFVVVCCQVQFSTREADS